MRPAYSNCPLVFPAALLASALVLFRIHGHYYARCFLEEHGIDSDVITELLGVAHKTSTD